ncbi:hypothetical protein [Kribbella sp. NPDC004875]|uniref:hypothetical protein n=1 Tax=Kribbella sp. NPDC004875 TaxID=3364107 RepID=UPI0036B6E80B
MTKEPIGSVAEEAAKLFAVLQHAAATAPPAQDTADGAADVTADGTAGDATDATADETAGEKHEHKLGPDCVWCPVCQLIHRVRNTSPETIEQLSSAAAHVLGSVRSLLEAAADAARQAREDAASRASAPEEETTRSRVDRIDVSEDPEPWD